MSSNCLYGKLLVIRKTGQEESFFPLNSSEITLGREPTCDVRLRCVDVSRIHAKIMFDYEAKQAFIEDMSSNGTLVNDEELAMNDKKALNNHDVITIGERRFRYESPNLENLQAMKSKGYMGTPKKMVTISHEECETPKKKLKFNASNPNGSRSLFKDLMTFKMNQTSALEINQQHEGSLSAGNSPKSSPKSTTLTSLESSPKKMTKVGKTPTANQSSMIPKPLVFNSNAPPASMPRLQQEYVSNLNLSAKKLSYSAQNTPKSGDSKSKLPWNNCTKVSSPSLSAKNSPQKRAAMESAEPSRSNKSIKVSCSPQVASPKDILNLSKDKFFKEMNAFVSKKPHSHESTVSLESVSQSAPGSPRRSSARKRNVTFGPMLVPEVFDKSQPPSSPLIKGEPAPADKANELNSAADMSMTMAEKNPKSILKRASMPRMDLSLVNSSDLCLEGGPIESCELNSSKKNTPMALSKTAKKHTPTTDVKARKPNNPLAHTASSPVYKSESFRNKYEKFEKGILSSPRLKKMDSPRLSVSIVKPYPIKLVSKEDESSLQEPELEESLIGVGSPLNSKDPVSDVELSHFHSCDELSIVNDRMLEESNLTKDIVESALEEDEDELCKFSDIFQSPQQSIIRHVQFSEKVDIVDEPKRNQEISYLGVRELVKTPKAPEPMNYFGVRELVHTPKLVPEIDYKGLKNLIKTPKVIPEMEYKGLKELVKSPKAIPNLENHFEPQMFEKDAQEEAQEKEENYKEVVMDEIIVETHQESPVVPKSIPSNSFYGSASKPPSLPAPSMGHSLRGSKKAMKEPQPSQQEVNDDEESVIVEKKTRGRAKKVSVEPSLLETIKPRKKESKRNQKEKNAQLEEQEEKPQEPLIVSVEPVKKTRGRAAKKNEIIEAPVVPVPAVETKKRETRSKKLVVEQENTIAPDEMDSNIQEEQVPSTKKPATRKGKSKKQVEPEVEVDQENTPVVRAKSTRQKKSVIEEEAIETVQEQVQVKSKSTRQKKNPLDAAIELSQQVVVKSKSTRQKKTFVDEAIDVARILRKRN